MIADNMLTARAVKLLEYWLLLVGLIPMPDYELRDYGPHRVYIVQARVPNGLAVDRYELLDHLRNFLDEQANLPGATRFHAYDIELYVSPYCGGYVFASIEHTA